MPESEHAIRRMPRTRGRARRAAWAIKWGRPPFLQTTPMMRLRLLGFALLLCIATIADAQEATTLAADTPRSTPADVTFTAPATWRLTMSASSVTLEPPEADSRI